VRLSAQTLGGEQCVQPRDEEQHGLLLLPEARLATPVHSPFHPRLGPGLWSLRRRIAETSGRHFLRADGVRVFPRGESWLFALAEPRGSRIL